MLRCFSDCVNEQSDKHSYYDEGHPVARPDLQPLESAIEQQEMYYGTEDLGSNRSTVALLQETRGAGGTVWVPFYYALSSLHWSPWHGRVWYGRSGFSITPWYLFDVGGVSLQGGSKLSQCY